MGAFGDQSPSKLSWVAEGVARLVDNVERIVKGKRDVVERAAVCMLAEGHVLVEDRPGTGKTTLAKALSRSIEGDWQRLQCTPDLLPTDVTGTLVWHPGDLKFEFRPGPVFTNILLADEINRSPAKTQSALLEVMQERQVTVDGDTYRVPRPFLVIATQNDLESRGVYELPEAQIDRFMIRTTIGYPPPDAEAAIVDLRTTAMDVDDLAPVMTTEYLAAMIRAAAQVHVSPPVRDYVVRLTSATRPGEPHPQQRQLGDVRDVVRVGASPRASVALARAAQARAASLGRDYVTAQDVRDLATGVLAHRLVLKPEASRNRAVTEALIETITSRIEDPVALARC